MWHRMLLISRPKEVSPVSISVISSQLTIYGSFRLGMSGAGSQATVRYGPSLATGTGVATGPSLQDFRLRPEFLATSRTSAAAPMARSGPVLFPESRSAYQI